MRREIRRNTQADIPIKNTAPAVAKCRFLLCSHVFGLYNNERWKVGGIIVSCGIAVVSLVLSILTRFGR